MPDSRDGERHPVSPATESDRRRRDALRLLVDEMMAQIRASSHNELWTAEERERAEADLDRIMQQVRDETLREYGS